MKMRSHMRSAVAMSCVLKTTVAPRRRISSTASFSTWALTGSRPENGSSRISSAGSDTTAAMNWTFCDIPFESVSICRSSSPGSSIRAIHSSIAASMRLRDPPLSRA